MLYIWIKLRKLRNLRNLKKQIIKETINACLEGREIEIPPISLVAQAIIQKRLRDQGVELRCYGLNNWPKTSSELIKLLLL